MSPTVWGGLTLKVPWVGRSHVGTKELPSSSIPLHSWAVTEVVALGMAMLHLQ